MLWFCSCCCRLFYQYPTCQNQVVLTSSSRLCCQFLSCFFFVRSFVYSTTYVLLEHTTLCCLFAPAIFRPFVAKAAIFRTLARRRLGDVKRKNHTHIFTKCESNYHTCLARYCNERPERSVRVGSVMSKVVQPLNDTPFWKIWFQFFLINLLANENERRLLLLINWTVESQKRKENFLSYESVCFLAASMINELITERLFVE